MKDKDTLNTVLDFVGITLSILFMVSSLWCLNHWINFQKAIISGNQTLITIWYIIFIVASFAAIGVMGCYFYLWKIRRHNEITKLKNECAELTECAYALESAINLAGNHDEDSEIVKEQRDKGCRLFNNLFSLRKNRKLVGVTLLQERVANREKRRKKNE